jgi:hypothetical protein
MTNDESVNKLIGLFVYYKSNHQKTLNSLSEKSKFVNGDGNDDNAGGNINTANVCEYQSHVSRLLSNSTDDIYRIQLLSSGGSDMSDKYQHVACQCLGILEPGGVPVYSPPAITSLAKAALPPPREVVPSSTTFASISNQCVSVEDVQIGSVDDLSTSALEDALLPNPSISFALPLGTITGNPDTHNLDIRGNH